MGIQNDIIIIFIVGPIFLRNLRCVVGDNSDLVVRITTGELEGLPVLSSRGKHVQAFLGIPYAAKPTGNLRFKPPLDVQPWKGVLQAKTKPVSCYQTEEEELKSSDIAWWVSSAEESEDCLYLNVWVPNARPKGAAVLVWIHGGSFAHGSSAVDNFDGREITSEEEIIVVSLNYRLSAFGFLYFDHPHAPGNVGLLDQEKALEWVQKNIGYFGGDPKLVTLVGHSSGAESAGLHFFNPRCNGLFKNVVLAGGLPPLANSTKKPSLLLAHDLGCLNGLDNPEHILHCLCQQPAKNVTAAAVSLMSRGVVFRPVLQSTYKTEGYIPENKAIMITNTREEGVVMLLQHFNDRQLSENTTFTSSDLNHLIKSYLEIPDSVALVFKHFYSEDIYPEGSKIQEQMIRFSTDLFYFCPAVDFLNLVSLKVPATYQMVFSHEEFGTNLLPSWVGTHHGEELRFFFGRFANKNFSSEEWLLHRRTVRYLANFAKFGNPNSKHDVSDLSLPRWPAYTKEGGSYVHLNTDPSIERLLSHRACSLLKILPRLLKALTKDRTKINAMKSEL